MCSDCFVGNKSCIYPPNVTYPTKDYETLRVEVEAGAWESRIFAPSSNANGKARSTWMCHTLHTNVSVNLEVTSELDIFYRA